MNASSAKDITISGSSSEERYGSGTDIGPHQGGDVVKLQPMDVLLGRGKKHRTHPGNVLYTDLVKANRHCYLSTTPPLVKRSILEGIVDQIMEQGRFLQRDDMHSLWVPVSRDRAMTKTALAIQYRQRMTLNNSESASRTRPCISPYYDMVNRWSNDVGAGSPVVEGVQEAPQATQQPASAPSRRALPQRPMLAPRTERRSPFRNYLYQNRFEADPLAFTSEIDTCDRTIRRHERSAFSTTERSRKYLFPDLLPEWRNEHDRVESQPCVQRHSSLPISRFDSTSWKCIVDCVPTPGSRENNRVEGGWHSDCSQSSDLSSVTSVESLDTYNALDVSFVNFEW